jgi:hypothetical protein
LLFPPPLSPKNKILSFSKVPHFFRATCWVSIFERQVHSSGRLVHFIFPCFAALCKGILGINNISQFSGIITGKLSIVYMSLPLQLMYYSYFPQTPLVVNVPSSTSKCTI